MWSKPNIFAVQSCQQSYTYVMYTNVHGVSQPHPLTLTLQSDRPVEPKPNPH